MSTKGGTKKANKNPNPTPKEDVTAASSKESGSFQDKMNLKANKSEKRVCKLGKFLVPGRMYCDCQAAKHGLLTNCLNCGKIICEQEGYGPCPFCGSMVSPPPSMKKMASGGGSSSAASASASAAAAASIPQMTKAIEHKDMMLNFDKTCAQRTVVLDDQADYYSTSEWLSPEEKAQRQKELKRREQKRQREEQERKKMHISFDFAGRRVFFTEDASQPNLQPQSAMLKPLKSNPFEGPKPVFESHGPPPIMFTPKSAPHEHSTSRRVQHDYFSVDPNAAFVPVDEDDFTEQAAQASNTAPCHALPICGSSEGVFFKRYHDTRERTSLLSLMHESNMNHYLFVPESNWRSLCASVVLTDIVTLCQQQKIELNVGIAPDDINLNSEADINTLTSKFFEILSCGVTHFSLFLCQQPNQKALGNRLAKAQAHVANSVIARLTEGLSKVAAAALRFYFCTFTSQVDFSTIIETEEEPSCSAPSPSVQNFWKELDLSLDKRFLIMIQTLPVCCSASVPALLPPQLSKQWALGASSAFPSHKLLLLDHYPATDHIKASVPFPLPYSGRDAGLWEHFEGCLVACSQWPYVDTLTLRTAFECLANPLTYSPLASLKQSLLRLFFDVQLVEDILALVEVAPCSSNAENDVAIKKQLSLSIRKDELPELNKRIVRVSRSLNGKIASELQPFFYLISNFLQELSGNTPSKPPTVSPPHSGQLTPSQKPQAQPQPTPQSQSQPQPQPQHQPTPSQPQRQLQPQSTAQPAPTPQPQQSTQPQITLEPTQQTAPQVPSSAQTTISPSAQPPQPQPQQPTVTPQVQSKPKVTITTKPHAPSPPSSQPPPPQQQQQQQQPTHTPSPPSQTNNPQQMTVTKTINTSTSGKSVSIVVTKKS